LIVPVVAITTGDLTFLIACRIDSSIRFTRVVRSTKYFDQRNQQPRPLSLSLVTHNSIFADLLISDFTRRVCLFEIRNQTVKDQPFSPSVHYKAQPSTISHQLSTAHKELSSNELGRTLSHGARPLLQADHQHTVPASHVKTHFAVFRRLAGLGTRQNRPTPAHVVPSYPKSK
jgi:hypothetical protein